MVRSIKLFKDSGQPDLRCLGSHKKQYLLLIDILLLLDSKYIIVIFGVLFMFVVSLFITNNIFKK